MTCTNWHVIFVDTNTICLFHLADSRRGVTVSATSVQHVNDLEFYIKQLPSAEEENNSKDIYD